MNRSHRASATSSIAAPRPGSGFWHALPLAMAISTGLWAFGFAVAEAIAHNV